MHIFLTGGSGYVGGHLAHHFIDSGHRVSALARSQAAGDKVAGLGARPVAGGLADTAVLARAAAEADAIVHAAVDFADPAMREVEEPALAALLDGARPGTPFVYTSTGLVYPDGRGASADEDTPVDAEGSPQPYKVLGERQALAARGPAVTVVRAALVHGHGGSGLLQGMIAGARERGAATYIGDGANAWSAVHVDDLARLYAAAIARAEHGLVVNAASRTHVTMRQLAEAVAHTTGTRAVSITREQAERAIGPYAAVLTRSTPLDPSRAERVFGWTPEAPALLDDLRAGSYA